MKMENKEKYYRLARNILDSKFKTLISENNTVTEIDTPIDDIREYWLALDIHPVKEITIFERVSCEPILSVSEESPKKINKMIRRIKKLGNKELLKGLLVE